MAALKVLAGLLAADFATAAVHWAEDTYLPHTRAPGLLGQIARDNDMHHFIPFSSPTCCTASSTSGTARGPGS